MKQLWQEDTPELQGLLPHLEDVTFDPESGLVLGSLGGALAAWTYAGESLERWPALLVGPVRRALALGGGLAATSDPSGLVQLVDASDPPELAQLSQLTLPGASGLAAVGSHLYVLRRPDQLTTIDISDPVAPIVVGTNEGLESPWAMLIVGDYGYVGGNTGRLTVFDLNDPAQPAVVGDVSLSASTRDLAHSNGYLYVAGGAGGLDILSLADPVRPEPSRVIETPGSVERVSIAGDVLWIVNTDGLATYSLANPAAPSPLFQLDAAMWSLDVVAIGQRAIVAEWASIAIYHADPAVRAPRLVIRPDFLFFRDEPDAASLVLTNRGGAELRIAGSSVEDARFELSLPVDSLAPGESTSATVTYSGSDGDPVESLVCISSNDPVRPVRELALLSEAFWSSIDVGDEAPDFLLPDVDGAYHRLLDQRGHPVLLAYFATW